MQGWVWVGIIKNGWWKFHECNSSWCCGRSACVVLGWQLSSIHCGIGAVCGSLVSSLESFLQAGFCCAEFYACFTATLLRVSSTVCLNVGATHLWPDSSGYFCMLAIHWHFQGFIVVCSAFSSWPQRNPSVRDRPSAGHPTSFGQLQPRPWRLRQWRAIWLSQALEFSKPVCRSCTVDGTKMDAGPPWRRSSWGMASKSLYWYRDRWLSQTGYPFLQVRFAGVGGLFWPHMGKLLGYHTSSV